MLATETSNVSVRTLCYSGIYIVGLNLIKFNKFKREYCSSFA